MNAVEAGIHVLFSLRLIASRSQQAVPERRCRFVVHRQYAEPLSCFQRELASVLLDASSEFSANTFNCRLEGLLTTQQHSS